MFAHLYDSQNHMSTNKPPQFVLNVFMSLKADCTMLNFSWGGGVICCFQLSLKQSQNDVQIAHESN